MLTRSIQPGYDLIYHKRDDGELIDLLISACRESVVFIQDCWGLPAPRRCPICFTPSLLVFIFYAAPWYQKVIYGYYLPYWWYDSASSWRTTGGCMTNFLAYPAICIKPPREIKQSDRSVGKQLFVDEPKRTGKLRNVVCHELTHAFTCKHRLPMWMNEGLAMLTAEKFLGYQTVQPATLRAIQQRAGNNAPVAYSQFRYLQGADIAYQYARGYWITRYLHEVYPAVIPTLLTQAASRESCTSRMLAALETTYQQFWQDIDMKLVAHFADFAGCTQRL